MTESQINIFVIVIGLPLFCLAFYLWIMAVRHMLGLMNNYKAGKGWGRFIAFSIFMPSFFTDKGNYHREQMLKYGGLFFIFCITPLAIQALYELFIE